MDCLKFELNKIPTIVVTILQEMFSFFFLFFKLSEDEEEGDDNLNEFIEENFGKLCVMTDDDLFAQIESDESFSLELLDREIREAGLDPPSW